MRQFGGAAKAAAQLSVRSFVPPGTLRPDHTWTWIPQHKMITAGDQFIWNFPNCGNPQKVQRYPAEWAESLREMSAKTNRHAQPSQRYGRKHDQHLDGPRA